MQSACVHRLLGTGLLGTGLLGCVFASVGCRPDELDCYATATCPTAGSGGGDAGGSPSAGGTSPTAAGGAGGAAGATGTGTGGTGGMSLAKNGEPCAAAAACASGFCADGVCCAEACAGACRACNLAPTAGTCAPHPPATDPDGDCAADGGVCDGAKSCASGKHLWSQKFGDAKQQTGDAVAVDATGNVIIAGTNGGNVNFGGATLTNNLYIAKFSAAGVHQWSKGFNAPCQAEDLVSLKSGSLVMSARCGGGTVTFGGPTVDATGGANFIVAFDKDGNHVWTLNIAKNLFGVTCLLAADTTDNIIAIGYYAFGNISFGGPPLVPGDLEDFFVAKLTSAGIHQWSRSFGGAGSDFARDVGLDASGDILIAGEFAGTIVLDTASITSKQARDAFLVRLDGAGVVVWAKSFTDGGGSSYPYMSVAAHSDGSSILALSPVGAMDLGGGLLTPAGSTDIAIARFDKNGVHVTSKRYGSAGSESVEMVRMDGNGNVVIGGFGAGADFGGGMISPQFIVKLGASFEYLWANTGAPPNRLAVSPTGAVAITGSFYDAINLGGGQLTSTGGTDVFAALLGP
jgi:hypothetical protein